MKIFVTGGAGYLGSMIVAELLDAGHDVIAYDNLSTGHKEAVPAGAELIQGDVGQPHELPRLLHDVQPDIVVHCALASLVEESVEEPATYFENNVANTLNLLRAMREAGINRIVFSGSASIYGRSDQIPVTENAPPEPISTFGDTVLMIERMLRRFDEAYGFKYVALRCFNAAGATETRGERHDPETHLIPRALQVALGQRDYVEVYGTNYSSPDGTAVRDYVHVRDLAAAHVVALDAVNRRSAVYNVGGGHGSSVRQVIDTVRSVTGHPIPVEHAPRRPGDPPVLIAGSARIQRELGWRPKQTSLHEIIRSAWEWHQVHSEGY